MGFRGTEYKGKRPRFAAVLDDQPVLVWGIGGTEVQAVQDCLYWTSEGGDRGREPSRVLPLTPKARRFLRENGDATRLRETEDGKHVGTRDE